MINAQRLINAGIDYPAGLERFMGDAELYEMVLSAFLEDTVLARAEKALAEGDDTSLFRCAHEMKGASANAQMTALNAAACELVELLRGGHAERAALESAFARFKETYLLAKAAVRAVLNGD